MSWPVVSFGDVLTDATGGNVKTKQSDYLAKGLFAIVDQGQSRIGGYTNDASSLCKVDGPVIIFGDHTKSIKYVDFPFCLGADGTKVLKPKRGTHPKYLYYALHQVPIPEAGYSRHFKYLKAGEIPLPPLEEQKRIAGILDQAAELCRLRTHALDKLNTLGQAIFYEMFGSGSFKRVALAEVIEARSSLADPTLPKNAQLPHVGPEHIRQGGAEIEWDRVVSCAQDGVTSGKYRFEPNDIIYSKIRPYLNKVAITDRVGMCSADMYALVANSDVVKNSYLHFILGSSDFLSYAASVSGRANIPKMNRKQLMAYEIPVAPLDMQAEFEGKISSIRGQAAKLSKSLSTGEKLFASLQHRAFRGEL